MRREGIDDGLRREVIREHDPILEVDAVVVDGERQTPHRLERDTGAVVHRPLRAQGFGMKDLRLGARHRERSNLERHRRRANEVDRRVREVLLA